MFHMLQTYDTILWSSSYSLFIGCKQFWKREIIFPFIFRGCNSLLLMFTNVYGPFLILTLSFNFNSHFFSENFFSRFILSRFRRIFESLHSLGLIFIIIFTCIHNKNNVCLLGNEGAADDRGEVSEPVRTVPPASLLLPALRSHG